MSLVQTIRVAGQVNCYLVGAEGAYALVDAGLRGFHRKLLHGLATRLSAPGDLRIIVITHGHFDHVGCLAAVRSVYDCPVLVHEAEAEWLRTGEVVIPPGCTPAGRAVSWIGRNTRPLLRFEAVPPDVTVSQTTSLAEWGIPASVTPTPGHSAGSISLVTPEGEACVGDLMANCLPGDGWQVFPPFAEDVATLYRSWESLLKSGVHTFYPGHGRPISAEIVRAKLEGHAARRVIARAAAEGEA